MKNIYQIAVTALILCVFACVPPPKGPTAPSNQAAEVLLRYKFPEGRISRYRVEEEGISKLGISIIPGIQNMRAVSSMVVKEKVAQGPMNGYALIEREIESYRLQVWQEDKLIFDSSRAAEFSGENDVLKFPALKGKVIRFEMNELGRIRNVQGLGEIYFSQKAFESMQMMEGGVPLFPEAGIAVGKNWRDDREQPFDAGEGYRGLLSIKGITTLVNLTGDQNKRAAVLNAKQELSISLFEANSKTPWKGFNGGGSSEGNFTFNIADGRIISSEMRTLLKVVTQVSAMTTKMETTLEMQLTAKSTLIQE